MTTRKPKPSKFPLKVPDPPAEVGWTLTDGRDRVRIGLANQGGRLEAFAATDRKAGKKWVQEARSSVQPNLPGPIGPILAAALKLFADKKAEVKKVLKSTRRKKVNRGT